MLGLDMRYTQFELGIPTYKFPIRFKSETSNTKHNISSNYCDIINRQLLLMF